MPSLPTVGDSGWGTTLNEFLQVAHGPDGKTRGIFNVREYGAVGDGTTDDRAAIQAAIDAASAAGGGCVLFPDGEVYKVTYTGGTVAVTGWGTVTCALKIKANVHLLGLGGATIYAPFIAGTTTCIGPNVGDGTCNDWSIRGLILDGGATQAELEADQGAIRVGVCSNFVVADNEFIGFRGKGIQVMSENPTGLLSTGFWIMHNYFHDFGHGNPISFHGGSVEGKVLYNRIADNLSGDGAAEAIHLSSNAARPELRMKIIGNEITAWGNINKGDLVDSVIAHNTITSAGSNVGAITPQDSTGLTIAHNKVDFTGTTNANANGIRVVEGLHTNLTIHGNTIKRGVGRGIAVTSGTRNRSVRITENTVTGGEGVEPDLTVALTDEVYIAGNNLLRTVDGAVVDIASGTTRVQYIGNTTSVGEVVFNCAGPIVLGNSFERASGNCVRFLGGTAIVDDNVFDGAVQMSGSGNKIGLNEGYAAPDYTITNATADRALDANASTLDELADVVGTLVNDLITKGILQ